MSGKPDAAARVRALDPSSSFIVKAPAGSGKTSLLVARYLALLATVEEPEEVVAITFTRKATAEMRTRVLEALALAQHPPPPREDAHAHRMHGLATAAAARDAARGWHLRDDPRRLAIHTIDALCASLARRLPVVSGLGGALAPVEDPLFLYRGAARRTLAFMDDPEVGAAVLRTLDHLDGNMAAFEDLMAQMLACRDQWMRYLRMDDAQARRHELEAGLAGAVSAGLASAREALPAGCADELAALGAFASARAVEPGTLPGPPPLARADALPGTGAGDLGAWKALAALLLTGTGALRKRPPGPVFSARETRAEYDRMKGLLELLAGAPRVAPALAAVQGLPAPAYDDAQWRTLLDLFQVLKVAVAALRLEFAAHGVSDFTEQVASASQALGEEQAPTDLALALDYRIRHLLLDEFQDTSAAHFEVVRKLTAGWVPGDGRTLFLVGDPMQSIYRFREAEVGLFLGCFHDGLDTVDLEPLTLSANFRSQAGLVDWVNGAFPAILPDADDPVRAAAAYEPSHATHPPAPGSAVLVHAARDEDETAQAARVAECVSRVRAGSPQSGIAVLLRARAQATALIRALKAAGLRWRGVDLEPLFGVPAVQDLHALCCALLHPLDRVNWLAVLRAPWCGLTLDDLERLAGDDPRAPVAALIERETAARRLSAQGHDRLLRVAPALLLACSRVGRDRHARLVARTWRALGGPACLDGARLEDARRYLRLLAELEHEAGLPDPDELARRAASLYAAPEPGAVDVEIMTIHKAKGLEFDIVILPGLERLPARDARGLLAWSETATPAGSRLLLAPVPPPEGEEHSPLNAFVRRVEQDKRTLESARLLYVACTRARERLHLFGGVNWNQKDGLPQPPRGDSLLAHLWPVVAPAFDGLAGTAPADAAREVRRAGGIARLPPGWCPPALAPGLAGVAPAGEEGGQPVEFSWAGDTARHVGVVAHGLLRRISEDGPGAWDAPRVDGQSGYARSTLEGLGVPVEELEGACDAVLAAVRTTLADARGRWLLSREHEHARSEYALSAVIGGTLVNVVLDRTFVDRQGVRWIVDYKTGTHRGGGVDAFLDREQQRYREQLEGYATAMRALDARPIRLALYFPALPAWREWAFETAA